MVAFFCVLIVADLYHVTLFTNNQHTYMGGDVAQLVRASDRHAADAGSIPQMRQEIFLPESTFSADSFTCVRTLPCAIACIYICAHVKDPVVRVRVRWSMETLKHPPCSLGWVVRLCRSWLFPGKATRISHGKNPGQYTCKK